MIVLIEFTGLMGLIGFFGGKIFFNWKEIRVLSLKFLPTINYLINYQLSASANCQLIFPQPTKFS